MAKKDQDKKSKKMKDQDKDFGLPEIEITPLDKEEKRPEPIPVPITGTEKSSEAQLENADKEEEPKKEEQGGAKESAVAAAALAGAAAASQFSKESPVNPHSTATTVPPAPPEVPKDPQEKEKSSSRSGWIILVLLLLGLVGFTIYYWTNHYNKPAEEMPTAVVQPKVADNIEEEPAPVVVEEPVEAANGNSSPSLEEITSKSDNPRYLVTVGAFIDGDLARDFSRKLNRKGYSTYLVMPGYGSNFYKLAIADFDNVIDATARIEEEQKNFKETLWVFKF
ncbi:hypothetical protein GCM10007049_28220 [Echinicola pacifica]|uniref:SPOR domain-containing protein n=2 Tax=Echinicola pacifica TaxID=346377 RepID=A0A918Q3Z3_9BACT|nr:hypothetical protein GCM10007049_28220 [Echinicola pacifica]